MFMAVDAADQQRFAVELQQAIVNFNLTKTDVPGFGFDQLIAAPQETTAR